MREGKERECLRKQLGKRQMTKKNPTRRSEIVHSTLAYRMDLVDRLHIVLKSF